MRQSKSLGNLQVGGPLRRKTGARDEPEPVFPASADAYELLDDCGRGVSATVWRARCRTNDKIVAVKVLNLEAQIAPLEDIVHEAHTMKAYKHEAILPLYVCFVNDTQLWMVMPYMEGGSVAHIMRYRYPDGLEEHVIATIMKEVISALAYIHSHNDIHRDVKAGNVLVDADGHVKLGDFGVAASIERDDWGSARARTTFAGTPCWMAPEVLEQAGYGPKADIWSAGITMLEMAHGHAPFSKLPPMKVLLMTLQLEAECGGRHFSRGMREVVASCLNKDASKRPTAKQLLSKGFFRQAKDADFLKRTLLSGLPPLPQRCMEIRMTEPDTLSIILPHLTRIRLEACMSTGTGQGRAATQGMDNERRAVASHISYITDVAQWDFNCSKSNVEAVPEGAAASWSSTGDQSVTGSISSRPSSSSRGDQLLQQPQQQQDASPGHGAGGVALGSSTSLDVPGQQVQQGVVGLDGMLSQHEQQLQQQAAGDVGPGARDVYVHEAAGDVQSADAATAEVADKAASPARQPPSHVATSAAAEGAAPVSAADTAAAAAAAAAAAHAKMLTCYAGGKTITTFPVSVPDTPDHSPLHSRPATPDLLGKTSAAAAGAAAAGPAAAATDGTRLSRPAAASFPGAPPGGSSASAAAVPSAKKHGRFTVVEGSSRYQGPELAASDTPAAALAEGLCARSIAPTPQQQQQQPLAMQRSASSPDMALLMSLQGQQQQPCSSGISSAVSGGASSQSDHLSPLSPLSPVSPVSPGDWPPARSVAGPAAFSNSSSSSSHPTSAPHTQQQQLGVAAGAAASHGVASADARAAASAGDLAAQTQPCLAAGQQQQQQEHHQQLQHKIAGFFSSHGLGKTSRGSSPASRDTSYRALQDGSSSSYAAGPGSTAAAGASSSSSSAGGPSLSRPAAALHEIYPDSYSRGGSSSREGVAGHSGALPRSRSPATAHGKAVGGKEPPTAAQFWQHVKEACAETAADVAHIFKSRSGASIGHPDRSCSRSPERPMQQQQPPASPPTLSFSVCNGTLHVPEQQQAAGAEGSFTTPEAGGAAQHQTLGTAQDSVSTFAAAAATAGVGPVARSGSSSSSLVRCGSRGSGSLPPVGLGALPTGSTSSSKPPRYQQTVPRRNSDEQQPKQPMSPQQAGQQQQQQQGLQGELQAMQQQPGVTAAELQEAAASMSALAHAAAAVREAAAAAAAIPQANSEAVSSRGSSNSDGGGGAAASAMREANPLFGAQQGGTLAAQRLMTLADLESPDDSLEAAPGGLSDLGSRELLFAQARRTSADDRRGASAAAGSVGSAAGSSAGGDSDRQGGVLASHALSSPSGERELVKESSVTSPAVERSSGSGSDGQPCRQLSQQQQQQQTGQQPCQSPAAAAAAATAAAAPVVSRGSSLLHLRAANSAEPAAVSHPAAERERGRTLQSASAGSPGASVAQHGDGQSRAQHLSASPSRRHKGRFTITET